MQDGTYATAQDNLDLLKKNSLDVKRERKIETVPIEEIYNVITQFHSPDPNSEISISEIYKQIGLSHRAFRDDQNKGKARLVTKYALLGLLFEKNKETSHEFTSHELGIIFSSLTHYIQTRSEPFQQEVKDIRKIVMNLIMET